MSAPDEVRAFVALPVPDDLKASIRRAIGDWERSIPGVRWSGANNLHLTLRFLGGRSIVELERLSHRLRELTLDVAPVPVVAGETGAFPGWRHPRVLWLGLSEADELERLAEVVDRAAAETGFGSRKRPFQAHITLGRVRDRRPLRNEIEPVRQASLARLGGMVREMILYRSELNATGAVHTPMAKFPLTGASS